MRIAGYGTPLSQGAEGGTLPLEPARSRVRTRAKRPADTGQRPPPLVRDLGTIARLYGEVFWMIGQRLQHGRDWEEKLTRKALMLHEEEARRGESDTRHRHN